MIPNLIKLCMGKLTLYHLIENNCPEFRNGLLDIYFFKLKKLYLRYNEHLIWVPILERL